MLRQVSSRNHRGKGGFRAKNALQISTLVAVCVWLLYQMKYSHDHRKAYEEKFRVDETQAELARFGRKDLLPHTIESGSVIDTRGKEDAVGKKQDDKHEEIEDGIRGDQVGAEAAEHKEHTANKVDQVGKELGVIDDQEHEERSHEAQEKSFKGDDASSEVVHNVQEVEQEEHTQEARERSFKADDASSAVDHVVQDREPEAENGLLDSSKGINSGVNNNATANGTFLVKTEPRVEHTKLEKKPSSSTTAGESDDDLEGQTYLEIVHHIDNETEPKTNSADELGNQVGLGLRSRDLSKNQIDVQKNHTSISEDGKEARRNQTTVVDPTNAVTDLQNQTTLHPLQEPNGTAKLEISRKEKSNLDNAVMASEESSKTSSVTSVNKPQESKDHLHSVSAGEQREKHHHNPSKVESAKEKAAG